ncbi:MAG: TfoX/Sxy family protein [Rhodobacterales bacterium]|nr:TfoX/Sxy family protein [Rhodobacterales bacterium]
MACDAALAARLRARLAPRPGVSERRMFGGVAFLLNGNMCVGVHKDHMVARVGEPTATARLNPPRVRPMDITGRPMKGWLLIDGAGVEDDGELADWVETAVVFVGTLPVK